MSTRMASGASNPNGAGLPMFSLRIRWPSASICWAACRIGPRMSYRTLLSFVDCLNSAIPQICHRKDASPLRPPPHARRRLPDLCKSGCCRLGILLLAAADSPVEVDQVIGGEDAGHGVEGLLGLVRHLRLVVQRQDLLGDEVVLGVIKN